MNASRGRVAVLLIITAAVLGCGDDKSPEESCKLICDELQECGTSIQGSSLAAGPDCPTQCKALIDKNGDDCRGSASHLAECFDTYSCSGDDAGCSSHAKQFSSDCP